MKKQLLIYLLLMLCAFTLPAQHEDSRLRKARFFAGINRHDSAQFYYDQVLLDNRGYAAIAGYEAGSMYLRDFNYVKASKYLEQSLLYSEDGDQSIPRCEILVQLSVLQQKLLLVHWEDSLRSKGIALARQAKDLGRFRENCAQKAGELLAWFDELPDRENMQLFKQAQQFGALANSFITQESNYARAIECYQQMLGYYRQIAQKQLTPFMLREFYYVYHSINGISKEVSQKIENQQQAILLAEKAIKQNPQHPQVKEILATALGTQAYYLLFTRQFDQALDHAKRALALDSSQLWIKANMAHAYLLDNQYRKARTLYLELKNQQYREIPFRDIFLNDFFELQKAGITHKDLPSIRAEITAK